MKKRNKKYEITDIFVYYDENNIIYSTSSSPDNSKQFIVLDFEKQQEYFVEKNLQVGKSLVKFVDDENFELVEISEPTISTVHTLIHKIKETTNFQEGCLIQRLEDRWRFKILEKSKTELKNQTRNLNFYLCQKSDIHFLFRTIKLELSNLLDQEFVDIPYIIKDESNQNKYSLVTEQYFKSYGLL